MAKSGKILSVATANLSIFENQGLKWTKWQKVSCTLHTVFNITAKGLFGKNFRAWWFSETYAVFFEVKISARTFLS